MTAETDDEEETMEEMELGTLRAARVYRWLNIGLAIFILVAFASCNYACHTFRWTL